MEIIAIGFAYLLGVLTGVGFGLWYLKNWIEDKLRSPGDDIMDDAAEMVGNLMGGMPEDLTDDDEG